MNKEFPVRRIEDIVRSKPEELYNILVNVKISQSYGLDLERLGTFNPKGTKNLVNHVNKVLENMKNILTREEQEPKRFKQLTLQDKVVLYLAACFHDIGKTMPGIMKVDSKGRVTFHRHQIASAQKIREVLPNLGYDAGTVNAIAHIVANHHQRLTKGMNETTFARLRAKFGKYFPHIITLIESDVTTQNPLKKRKVLKLTKLIEENFNLAFYEFDSRLEEYLVEKYSLKNGNLHKATSALKELVIAGKIGDAKETKDLSDEERDAYYTDSAIEFLQDKRLDLAEADFYNVFKPERCILDGHDLIEAFPGFTPGLWINEMKKRLVIEDSEGRIISKEQALDFVKELAQDETFIKENFSSLSTISN